MTGIRDSKDAILWSLARVVVAFVVMGAAGCGGNKQHSHQPEIADLVVTTSYPYQYLAQRLVGEGVEVVFPAAHVENPRIWAPQPKDIQRCQAADLIVTGGPALPYAEWIGKVSLPESKVADCSAGLRLADFIQIEDTHVVHKHGPEGEHSHPLLISYGWLDAAIVRKQAAWLAKRLQQVYPDRRDAIAERLAVLDRDLSALSFSGLADSTKYDKVIFTTPNLSFLARAMGVENNYLLWVEPEQNAEESKARIEELVSEIGEAKSVLLVISGEFAQKIVDRACPKDVCKIVYVDTVDRPPRDGDFLTRLQLNYSVIQDAFDQPELD